MTTFSDMGAAQNLSAFCNLQNLLHDPQLPNAMKSEMSELMSANI
jgi:hypothetical protein